MCGICGIRFSDTGRKVNAAQLGAMAATMMHRGPDDHGIALLGNTGLAHRRLSIIDRSGGRQPIYNEDGTMVIVFNGEIYNHEALRAALQKKGHRYVTRSDTETILHAYEEYGSSCLRLLRGMFAFVIYDAAKQQLFLARDRVGKKPLYYYAGSGAFVFASEIKAIFKSGLVKNEVNVPMLDFYLSLGYVPGSETMFRNIRKLEPGSYLTVAAARDPDAGTYWDLDRVPQEKISYPDACRAFREKLDESIRLRLMSEVPLGVFLSGGIDSSTIVARMSRMLERPIKTFSVGYSDRPADSELSYARQVAERFNTDHTEFHLSAEDLFDSIDALLSHAEEPVVESAGIALYRLSQLAKPHATVLLSGEGADESLAGYPIYRTMPLIERLHAVQRFVPGPLFRCCTAALGRSEKALKYADWLREPFSRRYCSNSFDLSRSLRQAMYTPQLAAVAGGVVDGYFGTLHRRAAGKSLLQRMLYIDTKTWLADDILLKADRMTMAASIELRAPFLDHELMEFAAGLPDAYKLRNGRGKHILREVMRNELPEQILFRRKRGFPVPLTFWFRGKLYARAREVLTDRRALDRGYFRQEYIHGIFDRLHAGEDLGRRVFSLLTLELWHRKYIDQ